MANNRKIIRFGVQNLSFSYCSVQSKSVSLYLQWSWYWASFQVFCFFPCQIKLRVNALCILCIASVEWLDHPLFKQVSGLRKAGFIYYQWRLSGRVKPVFWDHLKRWKKINSIWQHKLLLFVEHLSLTDLYVYRQKILQIRSINSKKQSCGYLWK